jgi:hypothetical protein
MQFGKKDGKKDDESMSANFKPKIQLKKKLIFWFCFLRRWFKSIQSLGKSFGASRDQSVQRDSNQPKEVLSYLDQDSLHDQSSNWNRIFIFLNIGSTSF